MKNYKIELVKDFAILTATKIFENTKSKDEAKKELERVCNTENIPEEETKDAIKKLNKIIGE